MITLKRMPIQVHAFEISKFYLRFCESKQTVNKNIYTEDCAESRIFP